jgi:hypothetical protein
MITSTASANQVCEACGRQFTDGEECFGTIIAEWGDDPYGLDVTRSDYDMSSGIISENWRCRTCFIADVPVQPSEAVHD